MMAWRGQNGKAPISWLSYHHVSLTILSAACSKGLSIALTSWQLMDFLFVLAGKQ
jgi:hypothetical protein